MVSAPTTISVPKGNPFDGRGMWIWEMPFTDGGNIAAIIAKAKRYKITTLLIKSADGTTYWKQFSHALVTELHEAGIRVCAWQFVYGTHPLVEAKRGAQAVKAGADCLVIDAESATRTATRRPPSTSPLCVARSAGASPWALPDSPMSTSI